MLNVEMVTLTNSSPVLGQMKRLFGDSGRVLACIKDWLISAIPASVSMSSWSLIR